MKQTEKKKQKRLFSPDSGLMYFLTKTGWIIILNVIFLITCIPIFTIGTSVTSLYYAMMKSVRKDRSYPVKEYFASFKRTFKTGSMFTITAILWLLLLNHLRMVNLSMGTENAAFLNRVYVAVMAVTVAVLLYLFPILSRFAMKPGLMVRLAFVMAVRFIGYTVILLGGSAALFYIWFYYLPVPVILFLPGAICFCSTFLMERALRAYMPVSEIAEDAWYAQ